jgi:uncharacterized protein (DUF488 family)
VLLTFGHGTATEPRIAELLRVAGVRRLVDIRTAPGSRRSPHVSRAELQRWLPEHGIAYRWEKRLGGWRKPRPDSPDAALRERPFAGYAAHMRSPEFRSAVDELLDEAAAARAAIMCAESVWWRCHRRMVADFVVLSRGVPVLHLCTTAARSCTSPAIWPGSVRTVCLSTTQANHRWVDRPTWWSASVVRECERSD